MLGPLPGYALSKLAILAVQEMHLLKGGGTQIDETFDHRLWIISSIDPEHANAKGVVIVLNKQMMNGKDATHHELIPGRAI
jgi:hypothetical protein